MVWILYWDRVGVQGGFRDRLVGTRPSPGAPPGPTQDLGDGRPHGFLLWFPGMMRISEWDTEVSGLQESLTGSCSSASYPPPIQGG